MSPSNKTVFQIPFRLMGRPEIASPIRIRGLFNGPGWGSSRSWISGKKDSMLLDKPGLTGYIEIELIFRNFWNKRLIEVTDLFVGIQLIYFMFKIYSILSKILSEEKPVWDHFGKSTSYFLIIEGKAEAQLNFSVHHNTDFFSQMSVTAILISKQTFTHHHLLL